MDDYRKGLIELLSQLDISSVNAQNQSLLQELETKDIDILYALYKEKAPVIEESINTIQSNSDDLVVSLMVGIQQLGANSLAKEYKITCINNLVDILVETYELDRSEVFNIVEYLEENESYYQNVPFSLRFELIAEYIKRPFY